MTDEPHRVQLKRIKDWRMPPNTVKVDRTTVYGNPFAPGKMGPLNRMPIDAAGAVGLFRAMTSDPDFREAAMYPKDLSALRGKNLACWCGLDKPCHADVLLEIANAPEVSP